MDVPLSSKVMNAQATGLQYDAEMLSCLEVAVELTNEWIADCSPHWPAIAHCLTFSKSETQQGQRHRHPRFPPAQSPSRSSRIAEPCIGWDTNWPSTQHRRCRTCLFLSSICFFTCPMTPIFSFFASCNNTEDTSTPGFTYLHLRASFLP